MKLSNCHNGPNGSHSLTFWISFLIPIAPTPTIHPTSLDSLWGNCRHLAGPRFLQRPAVLMEGEKNLAFKMIAIPGCTIMGSKAIKVGDQVTQRIFLRGGRVFTSMIGRFDQQNRNKAQCWASKRHKAPKGPKVGQPFLSSKCPLTRSVRVSCLCRYTMWYSMHSMQGLHVARSKNHVACQTLPNAIQIYARLLQFSRFEQDKSWATIPSPSVHDVHDRHQSQMTPTRFHCLLFHLKTYIVLEKKNLKHLENDMCFQKPLAMLSEATVPSGWAFGQSRFLHFLPKRQGLDVSPSHIKPSTGKANREDRVAKFHFAEKSI